MESLAFVPVADGTRLRVLRRGSGQGGRPVVFVHGLASNARLWDGVAERVASAGHPTVALDLRSHGRSEQAAGGHDTATAARDVLDVARAEGFDRPVVVGQSWGGNVVVRLAADADAVAGAVAVDGGAIDLQRVFEDWPAALGALTPPKLAGMRREVVEERLRAMHPDFEDWAVEAQLANFEVRSDGTIAPWLPLDRHLEIVRSLWEDDAEASLRRVAVPTRLVLVEGGPRAPWLDDVVASSERITRTVVRDRVHDVHAQDPDLVAGHVLDLLEQVGP